MKKAFTLIEMLVVIGIIAILAALLMPALRMAMRSAHRAHTESFMNQLSSAATMFHADYGDYPPSHWYEVDELFKFDYNGDGRYRRSDDEIWFDPALGVANREPMPSTENQGIEVFLACLSTMQGGSYVDVGDRRMVDNTDNDLSVNPTQEVRIQPE